MFLIDDDPDVQEIVCLALERLAGMTVGVCASPTEAVHEAAAFAPDLILLDVMMPQMDGLRVFEALRARAATAAVPVVFLTARPRSGEPWERAPVLGIVPKPFDVAELPAQLRELWARRG